MTWCLTCTPKEVDQRNFILFSWFKHWNILLLAQASHFQTFPWNVIPWWGVSFSTWSSHDDQANIGQGGRAVSQKPYFNFIHQRSAEKWLLKFLTIIFFSLTKSSHTFSLRFIFVSDLKKNYCSLFVKVGVVFFSKTKSTRFFFFNGIPNVENICPNFSVAKILFIWLLGFSSTRGSTLLRTIATNWTCQKVVVMVYWKWVKNDQLYVNYDWFGLESENKLVLDETYNIRWQSEGQ